MQKVASCLLILAIILSCLQYAAAGAIAATSTAKPTVTPSPTPTPKPVVTPRPAPGSVTGTVFDSIGNLVPNADVYLHDNRGVAMGLTASDRNGSYAYTELDPGNYAIVVQVDGYAWYRQFVVTAGSRNVSDIHIPDYVHYPMVTPLPPVNVNNSTPAGSKDSGKAVTPAPTPKPAANATTGNSTGKGNATRPATNTTKVNNSTANQTEEAGGGSPIDGIISGITGFFQSLFGL